MFTVDVKQQYNDEGLRCNYPQVFVNRLCNDNFFYALGWSGGAMVLGKLPVPGRPAYLD